MDMDIMDIAIPAAEVAGDRLFSSGRDMLATWRHSMKTETMRLLMILRDQYIKSGYCDREKECENRDLRNSDKIFGAAPPLIIIIILLPIEKHMQFKIMVFYPLYY